MSDIKDFKNYKRFPIQLSTQNIMLIHLFNDTNHHSMNQIFEGIDMREENQAAANYDENQEAAKQFFAQLEGHYCDAFLEDLIVEATRKLIESDQSRNKMDEMYENTTGKIRCGAPESRAQKALDKAKELI